MVCLFLVHSLSFAASDAGTNPFDATRNVNPLKNYQAETFLCQFNVLTFALGMYYMDTEGKLAKEGVREKLVNNSAIWKEAFGIDFDLDNIDFRKEGFTRYYPFSVEGRDFIVRIFDIREKKRLADCEVYYEGKFEKSNLAFQIIPGIKTLLNDKTIEKVEFAREDISSTCP